MTLDRDMIPAAAKLLGCAESELATAVSLMAKQVEAEQTWLTLEQATRRLGCSSRTIHRMREAGTVRTRYLFGAIQVNEASINAFIAGAESVRRPRPPCKATHPHA